MVICISAPLLEMLLENCVEPRMSEVLPHLQFGELPPSASGSTPSSPIHDLKVYYYNDYFNDD